MSLLVRTSLVPLLLVQFGCASDAADPPPACGTAFAPGSSDAHPDPFGAAAAGQARAGLWQDEAAIVQPAHGQTPIQSGDYLLVNEHIAVTIEAPGTSDGYNRFGGDIIAVDRVGDDNLPLGVSFYGESLFALSNEVLDASSVSIVADGSNGQAAIVRAIGTLRPVPFLGGGFLASFYPNRYGLEAAIDYVLEPGAEMLKIRLGFHNPSDQPYDVSLGGAPITDVGLGFFHGSKMQLVTRERGFQTPQGFVDFVGYVNDSTSFALRPSGGQKLVYAISAGGYDHFAGPGFTIEACSTSFRDHAELVVGEPEYDGLRQVLRRVDGLEPSREISGRVSDAAGEAVALAFVHVLDERGEYYARTRSGPDGSFVVHAPPGEAVLLQPQAPGYGLAEGTSVGPDETEVELAFAPVGTIAVSARDADSDQRLPVRVQVIPAEPPAPTPPEYGVFDEQDGRLHQEFAIDGQAELVVPPGEHRVVVSRGYEWELHDTTVDVAAGDVASVSAILARSVDTSDYLCADFHMHTQFSVDSTDPVEHKVKGAVADGLDIVVSSEHEWVLDFGPVVDELGLTDWAFGMPSEELTTPEWGHFGVVPLLPRPGTLNNGAVDWVGALPPAILGGLRELPEDPVVIVNHPRNSLLGYFVAVDFDPSSASGSSELWSDDFDAIEVFANSDFEQNREASVADWFALLEQGSTFWATGASDSHELRSTPAGYPRTCLYFGHDDPTLLTIESVRDALASGASTVSGGLFLRVTGPGGERPGETISTAQSELEFTVVVEAPSFVDVTELEVIVNGETVATEPLVATGSGPGKRFVSLVPVGVDSTKPRSFVVFHAKGEADLAPLHPGLRPFAVSNPFFVEPP